MTSLIDSITNPLKTAGETAQKLMSLRDTAKFGDAVIELQAQIMAAQQGALAAHQREATMAEEIRDLKSRMVELEAWDAEKQRYQLTELPPGVFVYRLKPDMQGSEPMHSICEKCYQNGKKSILHSRGKWSGVEHLKCHSCDVGIDTGYSTEPQEAHHDFNPHDY